MLQAKTRGGDILLGIDENNVKALKEGDPIHIHGFELGLTYDIVIMYGETLRDIAERIGQGDKFEEPQPPIVN